MIFNIKKSIWAFTVLSLVGCGGESDLESDGEFFLTTSEDNIKVITSSFDFTNKSIISNPKNGSISFDIDKNTIIYMPNKDFNGEDYFVVNLLGKDRDEKNKYNITVTAENDVPVILVPEVVERDYHNIGEEWKYKISVSDPEDKEIAITENDIDNHKELGKMIVEFKFNNLEMINETETLMDYGEFVYNKNNQTITHITSQDKTTYKEEFTVRVVDSDGVEKTMVSEVKVNYVNNKPVFNGGLDYETNEDNQLAIMIKEFVTDEDGDEVNISINTDSSIGSFVYNDGLEYTPNPSYFGDDSVVLILEDEKNEFSEYELKIKVNRIIDPLYSNDLNISVNEDESVNSEITYIDNEGIDPEKIKFKIKNNPKNGLLILNNENGIFKYEPFNNYNGIDNFIVTVYDDLDREVDVNVNIEVNEVYDPMILDSNVVYSTSGNIHFNGNLSSYVNSIDNLDITFDENIYNVNGSYMDVKENGDFQFVPSLNEYDSLVSIPVLVSDGVESDNLVVQVFINDELIKIFDNNSTKDGSLGNSKSPFKDINDLMSGINEGDKIYFCSNDIELLSNFEIPKNVVLTGYASEEKHQYSTFCENPNAESATNFIIQDGSEVLVSSGVVLSKFNFDNLSTISVIKNKDLETSDLIFDKINVNQLEPMANFIEIDEIKNIKIENSYFFNGNKTIELKNINGEITIKNNSFDNVKNPLKINEMGNNVILNIIKNNMLGFLNGVEILSTNAIVNNSVEIKDADFLSENDDSVSVIIDILNESDSVLKIENSKMVSDKSLDVNKNGINSLIEIKENEIISGKYGSVNVSSKGNGNELKIDGNTLYHNKNVDQNEVFSYINVQLDSINSKSFFDLEIMDNYIKDNGFNTNQKDSIKIDVKSTENNIDLFSKIIGNIVEEEDSDIVNFNTLDSINNINFTMIFENNDMSNTLYNSLTIKENNLSGCLDINLNKLSNLELINNNENSVINLYDPKNESEYSIYSRQIEVGNYLPIENYGFSLNECAI